eukprot:TRINITY_DN995_c0_g1_i2.p1 TRINITY_DN995_c0_g1~~TRINITY_DN995_c0_g1_i2.p1  ORF type:complete len:242 (-),score=39.70 TRINITY_DN995_c0_g1_i2:362-1087(-)
METPYSQLSHVFGAQSVPLQTNTSTTVAELRRIEDGDEFIQKLREICLLDGGMERDVSIYLDQLEASLLQFFDELDKLSPSNQRECITLLRRCVYDMPEDITRGGDTRNVRMHAAFEEVANCLSRFHEVRLIPETSESNQSYKKEKITKVLDDFRWRVLNCRSSILNARKNNKVGWDFCINYLRRPFPLVAAGSSILILLWIYHTKYGFNEAPSVGNSITQDGYQLQRNGTSEVHPPTLHD